MTSEVKGLRNKNRPKKAINWEKKALVNLLILVSVGETLQLLSFFSQFHLKVYEVQLSTLDIFFPNFQHSSQWLKQAKERRRPCWTHCYRQEAVSVHQYGITSWRFPTRTKRNVSRAKNVFLTSKETPPTWFRMSIIDTRISQYGWEIKWMRRKDVILPAASAQTRILREYIYYNINL